MAPGMSAEEVLTTTRGVRRRLDLARAVERKLLVDCTRVAQQAPSGRNRQRWDFLFVTDPERRAGLAELWRLGLTHPTGDDDTAPSRQDFDSAEWQAIAVSVDHLVEHLHEVPVLLVPCVRIGPRRAGEPGHPGRYLGVGAAGSVELHAGGPRSRPGHGVDHSAPALRTPGGRSPRHSLRLRHAVRPDSGCSHCGRGIRSPAAESRPPRSCTGSSGEHDRRRWPGTGPCQRRAGARRAT